MNKNADYELPTPSTAPELFDGLLKRRVLAYLIDLAVLAGIVVLVSLVSLVLGILTLGATFVTVIFAIPLAIVAYYSVTLGSEKRATIGMGMMDLVLTPVRGGPLNGWRAFAHPLVFWLTIWILPPLSYLFALFTPRRQMIHDLIMGVLMVRRSPMEAHWEQQSAY
ncbi:MAG: RDD family protein [Devosiaceae bacterium]|nr:RDD family protein [Devosiaceae bacterium]